MPRLIINYKDGSVTDTAGPLSMCRVTLDFSLSALDQISEILFVSDEANIHYENIEPPVAKDDI